MTCYLESGKESCLPDLPQHSLAALEPSASAPQDQTHKYRIILIPHSFVCSFFWALARFAFPEEVSDVEKQDSNEFSTRSRRRPIKVEPALLEKLALLSKNEGQAKALVISGFINLATTSAGLHAIWLIAEIFTPPKLFSFLKDRAYNGSKALLLSLDRMRPTSSSNHLFWVKLGQSWTNRQTKRWNMWKQNIAVGGEKFVEGWKRVSWEGVIVLRKEVNLTKLVNQEERSEFMGWYSTCNLRSSVGLSLRLRLQWSHKTDEVWWDTLQKRQKPRKNWRTIQLLLLPCSEWHEKRTGNNSFCASCLFWVCLSRMTKTWQVQSRITGAHWIKWGQNSANLTAKGWRSRQLCLQQIPGKL